MIEFIFNKETKKIDIFKNGELTSSTDDLEMVCGLMPIISNQIKIEAFEEMELRGIAVSKELTDGSCDDYPVIKILDENMKEFISILIRRSFEIICKEKIKKYSI